jgi:hypothetical protein
LELEELELQEQLLLPTEVLQDIQDFLLMVELLVLVDKLQAIAQVLVQERVVLEIIFLQVLTLAELAHYYFTLLEEMAEPQLVQQLLAQRRLVQLAHLEVEEELIP